MSAWGLMIAMAGEANNNNQSGLSKLINDADGSLFLDAGVMDVAINAFLITRENVSENIDAANKLVRLSAPDNMDLKSSFRASFLSEMVKEISA